MPGPVRKSADRRTGHSPTPGVALMPGASGDNLPAPPCPPRMLKPAVAAWERLWQSPIGAAIDRDADLPRLERWIVLVNEWWRVHKRLKKSDMLVDGSQGQKVLNPLYSVLLQLEAKIAETEKEFGLTPKARAALGLDLGRMALTAEQLNRMTNDVQPTEADVIDVDPEGEWQSG